MTIDQFIMTAGGVLLTLLNGWVVYFLRSIHADFSQLVSRFNALDKDHGERLAVIEWRLRQVDHDDMGPRRRTDP